MSIMRKVELSISILYSLAIVASATPVLSNISNIPVVIYYLFVPGYSLILLLNEKYDVLDRFAYSILFGPTFVLVIFSIRQIFVGVALPFNIIIPTLTIAMSVYHYLRPGTISLIEVPTS